MKKYSPRELSLIIAAFAAIVVFIFSYIQNLSVFNEYRLLTTAGGSLLSLLIIYIGTQLIIRNLFLEKLKVIYKMIRRSNSSADEEITFNNESDVLSMTEQDVMKWTMDKSTVDDQMKALENYRKEFLGNISHELKTPLFSIQGYVLTLLDGAMQDPKILKKYLKKTAQNVDRLNGIVEDLGVISKLESGQLILDLDGVNISNLILQSIENLDLQAEEAEMTLVFEPNGNESVNVKGDHKYLQQVFANLIGNAIKYGKEGGEIKIVLTMIEKQILIEVIDDGIGISKEHLPHVFDRFYRVDPHRNRKAGGSGIGLAIVKHILDVHNQTIQVSSELEKGSNFSFTLDVVA